MALITTSFQAEAPLHPAAFAHLEDLFGQGWADPSKLSDPSRHLAVLLEEAKATFAAGLGIKAQEIYFLGEPPLAFHLGINGLLEKSSRLFYSGTDRQPVHAIVGSQGNLDCIKLEVDENGQVHYPEGNTSDLLVHQPINPETGIVRDEPENFAGKVFVDNSAYGISPKLPENWSAAMWQSRSWQGPSALAILAIRENVLWRNPLPHNDPAKVPQAFSAPLALMSAIAFENFSADDTRTAQNIAHMKKEILNFIRTEIGGVIIVGEESSTSPHLVSVVFEGVDSERIVNLMSERGIAVDAGSACLSGNMAPSHVLAAMGLPVTGNLRLTLHPQVRENDIDLLLNNLKEVVLRERQNSI